MKYWAQFYTLRAGQYVEPLGDRSIIQLDGRLSKFNMHLIAMNECQKRKYDGFRLARGLRLDNLFFLNAAVQIPNHLTPTV